ncbi:RNA dependent RNA polymerase-domain-containing protein [Scleroderma citrinum]
MQEECTSPLILGKRKATTEGPVLPSPTSPGRNITNDESLHVIAHHPHLQKCFDAREIRFGVQWQIARLVTLGHIAYKEIPIPTLDKLTGPNQSAAPLVDELFCKSTHKTNEETTVLFSREKEATLPWKDLDREYEYANMGERFHRKPDGWYGGKVHFTASIKLDAGGTKKGAESSNYRIVLNRPELGSSTRFSREFGSHSILRVRVSRQLINKAQSALVKFFSQRFLLCGIVYRVFYAKDNSVFLWATDESCGLPQLPRHARPPPLSLMDFLNWHNPILHNQSQSMTKWASRFALGLSNSVPGIEFEPTNIMLVDDIVVDDSIMTDGCGFINLSALKRLRAVFGWDVCPTAIQCRIAGAKGLLIVHPDPCTNESDIPCVWLRPSQIKIKYPDSQAPLPKGHVTIDILRSSHMRSPSCLAAETIVNLAENGVPYDVFVNLMMKNLDDIVDKLLEWEGPNATFNLWENIARGGGVVLARMAREAAGEARMRGFSDKDMDEDDDEDGLDGFQDSPQSVAWWTDEISGCPSSIGEVIVALLDSGFTPHECAFLADKLKHFIRGLVKAYLKHPKLKVAMSCIAWIVPDPSGTLAPDEVQILAGKAIFPLPDGTMSNCVVGDVLLARHPCKVPTDTQKVKAVAKPQLCSYVDVIVCSVQGSRRFADLLAGGDYDGDKAIAIWQPAIVSAFKNAPLQYSFPPKDLPDNFKKDKAHASDLLEKHGSRPAALESRLQAFLIRGLQDQTLVGKYSNFHDIAIYILGYAHPETIRLAYMFCHVLDSAKTGLTVLPEVLRNDTREFNRCPPLWKGTTDDVAHEGNEPNVVRPASLPPFVMDVVSTKAKQYSDLKLSKLQQAFPQTTSKDNALLKPWDDVKKRVERIRSEDCNHAARMDKELSCIQSHVDEHFEEFKAKVHGNFTAHKIERRQDILRKLAQQFAKEPSPTSCLCFSEDELAHLKASYAYKVDPDGRFSFSVAMRDLGYIKARSCGPSKTVLLSYYDRFVIKTSFFR